MILNDDGEEPVDYRGEVVLDVSRRVDWRCPASYDGEVLDHRRESIEAGSADSELEVLRAEGVTADRWQVLRWMQQVATHGEVGSSTTRKRCGPSVVRDSSIQLDAKSVASQLQDDRAWLDQVCYPLPSQVG